MMKFLIDLCLSPKTKEFLRSNNYEAIRVDEIKLERATDREIFEYAVENNYILLTADLDFSQILSFLKYNKPSVVIFRLEIPSPEHINKYLKKIINQFYEELESGAIIIVKEDKIRIRKLPIE